MVTCEVCVEGFSGAQAAEEGGAHRIELCAGLVEGGTTPSHGALALALERLEIPTMVLIRPRGGDFLYSREELECMLREIVERTGAREVHFTAFSRWESPMAFRNPRPLMGGDSLPGEYERIGTDPAEVWRIMEAL